MESDRWQRIQAQFHRMVDLDAEARGPFLRQLRDEDVGLAEEVERLFQAFLCEEELEQTHRVTTDPVAGTMLSNDLEILEEVGSGGMGIVYRARQRSLGRIVAIKTLRAPLSLGEREVGDFKREAGRISGLRHPNIVRVHSVGEAGGLPYFVMDFIDGQGLDAILARARADGLEAIESISDPPLSHPIQSVTLIAALADAIQHSHSFGIIHRDIKPSNILIDREGRPFLVDFGIARELDGEPVTQRVMGTPHYMSPEQARLRASRVDQRTDIYSLGVVLYEMLTLRRPFEGRTNEQLLAEISTANPKRIRRQNSRIPSDIASVCEMAMYPEVAGRYRTAGEFADDLRRLIRHESPHLPRLSWWSRARRSYRTHKKATLSFAAIFVLAAVVVMAARWRTAREVEALALGSPPTPISAAEPRELCEALDQVDRLEVEVATLRGRAAWELSARSSEHLVGLGEALRRRREEIKDRAHAIAFYPADGAAHVLGREARRRAAEIVLGRISSRDTDADGESLVAALITIRSTPPDAIVYARLVDERIDAPAGDFVAWGKTPLIEKRVDPGFYHFLVVGDDGRYAEHRLFTEDLGGSYEVPVLPLRSVEGDMIKVPAISIDTTAWNAFVDPVVPARLPVESFYVDRYEVTNREYREFLMATGHPAPTLWPADHETIWQASWDNLPVTCVSAYDADAYARWVGKRLPTKWEWLAMARGAERAPPVNDPDLGVRPGSVNALLAEELRSDIQSSMAESDDRGMSWKVYLSRASEVGAFPEDRSWVGAMDVKGNVAEWTATRTPVFDQNGMSRASREDRIEAGYSFACHPRALWMMNTPKAWFYGYDVGFRCAKTSLTDLRLDGAPSANDNTGGSNERSKEE